jgi:hypothetical protein
MTDAERDSFLRDFNAVFAKHRLQLMASEWLSVEPCDDPVPWELDAHGNLDPVPFFGPVYDRALAGHTQAELDARARAALDRAYAAALLRIEELRAETETRRARKRDSGE